MCSIVTWHHSALPHPQTKKRNKEKEPSSTFRDEMVFLVKESTSQLMLWTQPGTAERDRDSFCECLHEFTCKMPTAKWREFQWKTIPLALENTPADFPQQQHSRCLESSSNQSPILNHFCPYFLPLKGLHHLSLHHKGPTMWTFRRPDTITYRLSRLSHNKWWVNYIYYKQNVNFVSLAYLQSASLLCTT